MYHKTSKKELTTIGTVQFQIPEKSLESVFLKIVIVKALKLRMRGNVLKSMNLQKTGRNEKCRRNIEERKQEQESDVVIVLRYYTIELLSTNIEKKRRRHEYLNLWARGMSHLCLSGLSSAAVTVECCIDCPRYLRLRFRQRRCRIVYSHRKAWIRISKHFLFVHS